jgi:RNA polymerase sigma factor (sigma-70 family)
MMEPMTLVERATKGDGVAFAQLVTQHHAFVYTICLSQVGHAAEAEDLTQEVFVRVFHDLADLREPEKFLRWLRQVARAESVTSVCTAMARPPASRISSTL